VSCSVLGDSRVEPELAERQGLSYKLSEGIQVRHFAHACRGSHGFGCCLADERRACVDAFADSADIDGRYAIDRAGGDV